MIILIIIGGFILGVVGFLWLLGKVAQRAKKAKPHLSLSNLKKGQIQTEILLRSVADGVIVADTNGQINLLNPAAADMIGWSAEDATSLDIHAVMKLADETGKPLADNDNPFNEVIKTKQAVKKTLQLVPKTGQTKVISLVMSPIVLPPNYELLGAVAVIRDISRQHQEESQRAEFISTASHEMRTPVAAIEGYLALALNPNVSQIDSKARDYLEKAHASTQHLGKLFQDLLTSARAEDGRLSSHPQVINVGELLEQIVQDMKFAVEKKGLTIELVTNSSSSIDASDSNSKVIQPLYYVYADPDRLNEVVTNLCDNAIKYTDSGKISIGLTGNNEVVQFFVQDTGPGISAEDIPHLFQKFYRINNTLTRTQGGTGLGLFISRKIIELYNGRIWVESKPNQGSAFYINLPRLSSDRAEQLKKQEAAQSPLANSV